ERNFIIFLKPAGLHPRLELRYRLTQEALAASRVEFETVEAPPGNTLAQMLTLTLFGDYVSYYLAILNGIDPTPVEPIEMLKQRLAR
ncbi:MAG TPA: SIS domain-containing protein, partial [Dehalococcoidia bacterium]|nr:SIS domain-containing protein [Dehalococcoidia bacterium]